MSDLKHDLLNTPIILHKVRTNSIYAQNLYAAMCNNYFIHNDTQEEWSCSWSISGIIVAQILQKGNYTDWYRSSCCYDSGKMAEGVVTDEIRSDLKVLRWSIVSREEK